MEKLDYMRGGEEFFEVAVTVARQLIAVRVAYKTDYAFVVADLNKAETVASEDKSSSLGVDCDNFLRQIMLEALLGNVVFIYFRLLFYQSVGRQRETLSEPSIANLENAGLA